MVDHQLINKLEDRVQANPESADPPFVNGSTGDDDSVRALPSSLKAGLAGRAVLSETAQAELNKLETWVGAL